MYLIFILPAKHDILTSPTVIPSSVFLPVLFRIFSHSLGRERLILMAEYVMNTFGFTVFRGDQRFTSLSFNDPNGHCYAEKLIRRVLSSQSRHWRRS
jgi:hypothetical protein